MRKCLNCGTGDNITRDHVVSRVTLKLALGKEMYERFCATVRKLNIMDLCGPCNNLKGDKSVDLRDIETQMRLQLALIEFGLDPDDIFSTAEEVFGDTGVQRPIDIGRDSKVHR